MFDIALLERRSEVESSALKQPCIRMTMIWRFRCERFRIASQIMLCADTNNKMSFEIRARQLL